AVLGLRRDRYLDHREHPRRAAGDARGHRRAAARVAAAAARGADPLLVRADRARRRLGRLRHPDDGRARRRRLRSQRLEDVHHQRRSRERVQFGQPIAMNQGVNFLIADMAAEIEAARLLCWQAAWLLDQGKRATLQSSYAKRFSADTAMKVTTDAVQVFGGYGYIKEFP